MRKSACGEQWVGHCWRRLSGPIRRHQFRIAHDPGGTNQRHRRRHLPTLVKGLTRNLDSPSSLISSWPRLSLSSLSNSASMNFIHSCLEILPFWSVSIRSSNCLACSSPRASLSWAFGTAAFVCAIAPPSVTRGSRQAGQSLQLTTRCSFASTYIDSYA